MPEDDEKVVTTLEDAKSTLCEDRLDPGFRENDCDVDGETFHAVTNCWGEGSPIGIQRKEATNSGAMNRQLEANTNAAIKIGQVGFPSTRAIV